MSDYNGWSNYETWATNLWLCNEEGSYLELQELARQARKQAAESQDEIWARTPRGLLAEALQDWVEEEMLPDLGGTLASDLLGAAVSEIDWHEIATATLEGLEDG